MDLSGYSLTITSGVRGIDVKIKELALRQGGTRLTGHTYPNLMQAGGRIKSDFSRKFTKLQNAIRRKILFREEDIEK